MTLKALRGTSMTHIMGLDMFVRTKMALSVIQISTGLVFFRQNLELALADTDCHPVLLSSCERGHKGCQVGQTEPGHPVTRHQSN